jgi:hypothetical protein
MFSPEDRIRLRDILIATARADERITSAALTGSAALEAEDRWSDIDLALGVADEANLSRLVADWTDHLYRDHGAVYHVDVNWGNILFRVLSNKVRHFVNRWDVSLTASIESGEGGIRTRGEV